VKHKTKRK